MKNLYIIIIGLWIGFFQGVSARGKEIRFPSIYYWQKPVAGWSGDSLVVRFGIEVAGWFAGATSLHIVPVYSSGKDHVRYPELIFSSPWEACFYKRRQSFREEKRTASILSLSRRHPAVNVDYRQAQMVPSTAEGHLLLQLVLYTCCDSCVLESKMIEIERVKKQRDK